MFLGLHLSWAGRNLRTDYYNIRLDDVIRLPRGAGVVEGAMSHVEVRNQEQIGDCYAHSAAQIFDAWRFTHGDHRYDLQSSGFELNQRFKIQNGSEGVDLGYISKLKKYIVRKFKIQKDNEDIDGGKLAKTLPLMMKQGTCDQGKLNQIFKIGNVDQYASEVMRIYNEKAEIFHEKMAQLRHQIFDQPYPSRFFYEVQLQKSSRELQYFKWDTYFRNQYKWEGINLLKQYHHRILAIPFDDRRLEKIQPNKNTVAIFETIGIIACNQKIFPPVPFQIQSHREYDLASLLFKVPVYFPDEALQVIHRELDRGLAEAEPIGISYCASVLKRGRAYEAVNFLSDDENICGRHASLVIGRRHHPKTHVKQLLIRNSWGRRCSSSYHPDWDCEASRGTVWVDEAILAKAIFQVQEVIH